MNLTEKGKGVLYYEPKDDIVIEMREYGKKLAAQLKK